jgi:hypothetical protein
MIRQDKSGIRRFKSRGSVFLLLPFSLTVHKIAIPAMKRRRRTESTPDWTLPVMAIRIP